MTALELIAVERRRQIEQEGWTPEHDAREHDEGDIAYTAACYAAPEPIFVHREAECSFFMNSDRGDRQLLREGFYAAWPWDEKWDKRNKHSRERQLVIAGALIVAELERLAALRAAREGSTHV